MVDASRPVYHHADQVQNGNQGRPRKSHIEQWQEGGVDQHLSQVVRMTHNLPHTVGKNSLALESGNGIQTCKETEGNQGLETVSPISTILLLTVESRVLRVHPIGVLDLVRNALHNQSSHK